MLVVCSTLARSSPSSHGTQGKSGRTTNVRANDHSLHQNIVSRVQSSYTHPVLVGFCALDFLVKIATMPRVLTKRLYNSDYKMWFEVGAKVFDAHYLEESDDDFGPGLYVADEATITVLESDIIGLDFDCAPVRAHTIKLSEVHINGNDWLELTVDEHNEILSKIGGREERSGAEPG
eukprot:SAG11_NODE_4414_length_1906_cov_1.158273_1_plen_176_part_10